MTNMIYDLG